MIRKTLAFAGVILLTLVSYIAISIYAFRRQLDREIVELTEDVVETRATSFKYADLSELPVPVQKYLKYALKDVQPTIQLVRLKQTGLFRTGANQPWLPIEAEQYFVTDPPAFVWHARVKPASLFWIEARDKYVTGQGNMLIKPFSAVTVANATGKEIDVSSLLRFLAEMPWFPTVFLPSDYLQWEEIDSNSARAIIRDRGLEASATFYFNDKGEITHLVSEDRYRTVGNEYVKEKWSGYYRNYQALNGLKIPTEVEVVWNLADGNLSYAKLTITNIQYNVPSRY